MLQMPASQQTHGYRSNNRWLLIQTQLPSDFLYLLERRLPGNGYSHMPSHLILVLQVVATLEEVQLS
jgi:hypothetical protein